jgi:hypothetical protein
MNLKSWYIRVITKLEHLAHEDDSDVIFDSNDAFIILDLIDELQKEIGYLEEDNNSLKEN